MATGGVRSRLSLPERIPQGEGRLHWIILLGPAEIACIFGLVEVFLWVSSIFDQVQDAPASTIRAAFLSLDVHMAWSSILFSDRNGDPQLAHHCKRKASSGQGVELFLPNIASVRVDRGMPDGTFGHGTAVFRGTDGTSKALTEAGFAVRILPPSSATNRCVLRRCEPSQQFRADRKPLRHSLGCQEMI